MASDVLIVIALIILGIVIWLFVPAWIIKRNTRKVIKIFRQKNAIGMQNAKSVYELGLNPPSLAKRIMSLRDYKPKALEFLIQVNVVFTTEDGKLYITEQSLVNATWLKMKR
jgi:hypothetical protein